MPNLWNQWSRNLKGVLAEEIINFFLFCVHPTTRGRNPLVIINCENLHHIYIVDGDISCAFSSCTTARHARHQNGTPLDYNLKWLLISGVFPIIEWICKSRYLSFSRHLLEWTIYFSLEIKLRMKSLKSLNYYYGEKQTKIGCICVCIDSLPYGV